MNNYLPHLVTCIATIACLWIEPVRADFFDGLAAYERRDYAAAINEFLPLAEADHPDAQIYMGHIAYLGTGTEQSKQEAADWYRRSADQGSYEGTYWLAVMLDQGDGISQNGAEATFLFDHIQSDAHLGIANAQQWLGSMYTHGLGVEKDLTEAFRWFVRAAEQGDPFHQTIVGNLYNYGRGVEKSGIDAANWYLLAAEQGHADAQASLGSLYLYGGVGLAKDRVEAMRWFLLAAEQGSSRAEDSIAGMYRHGWGVEQSDEEAAKWYLRAAERGHAFAAGDLAEMYEEGSGVLRDYKEAIKWYIQAAEGQEPFAPVALAEIYFEGRTGVFQDLVEAHKWANIAVVGGDDDGIQIRDRAALMMTPAQIQEAQKLAREWAREFLFIE